MLVISDIHACLDADKSPSMSPKGCARLINHSGNVQYHYACLFAIAQCPFERIRKNTLSHAVRKVIATVEVSGKLSIAYLDESVWRRLEAQAIRLHP